MNCITTMVSGTYQWYIPLFLYCVKKEYPEYDVKIFIRGKNELQQTEHITDNICNDYSGDGYITAALRFLECEHVLKDYDNVLITDVDILMMREKPALVEQHLTSMNENKLGCYDNYFTRSGMCPGVHFITKDWWDKTRAIRTKFMQDLRNREGFKDLDETILYRIIKDSGLPLPSNRQYFWTHGIHLGRWRVPSKARKTIGATESLYLQNLLNDNIFMDIVEESKKNIPELKHIFNALKELFL